MLIMNIERRIELLNDFVVLVNDTNSNFLIVDKTIISKFSIPNFRISFFAEFRDNELFSYIVVNNEVVELSFVINIIKELSLKLDK